MIKNIKSLKNFGIFSNHSNSGAKDFGRLNLFYGWNGSGKSTLSSLFRSVENRSLYNKFQEAEFSIEIDEGVSINPNNINTTNLNVYTFNAEFIEENISWNSLVKSILLVDKEKIEERQKLEELKKNQETDITVYEKENVEIEKLTTEVSKFGTASAKRMKTSLQAIDTTDSYYLNYNKTKFQQCISSNVKQTKNDSSLLNENEIVELTNAAKPDKKSLITVSIQTINNETFAKAHERLSDLLGTSVVSQSIKRLMDNSDIKSWVETGLDLHKRHDSGTCEFCGSELLQSRITTLEGHFNDEYKSFKSRLQSAVDWLGKQYVQEIPLPLETALYDEFKVEYQEACSKLSRSVLAVNEEILMWQKTLEKKVANPLETNLTVEAISESSISAYTAASTAIKTVIDKHNHKSQNFQEETAKAKKTLEIHFATAEVKEFGYHEKQQETSIRAEKNKKLSQVIVARRTEIQALEDSLSNEGLGAEQFNESLHKFLGRGELTLRFDQIQKGYEIIRNDEHRVNGRLSEGEKTAIAFVYFITKLKENDNRLEDTIVVVDDPVSSFDSNHLFHAYSFLRSNCDKAKQLFVLTHNFTYFKLMRDWFEGVNRNRRQKSPPKDPVAFYYTIEATTEIPRQSTFKDADQSLVNYNSEYHYIFSRLFKYKDSQTLSRDEAFLTANLARKLLESFFSFKFPKHRNDIAQLMNCGLNGCVNTDEAIKEKIYRFINKYSHSVVIEVNEDSSENLAGESQNVIGDIFTWIEEVDCIHFNEMVSVVT